MTTTRKVLVTGGAGFIGSHIVDALIARGDQVIVLDDFSTGHRSNLAGHSDVQLTIIEGSVTDKDTVFKAVQGCALIYHEAAIASVPRSVEDPLASHAVNLTGSLNVLAAAKHHGVKRVVFAGSAAVYGSREGAVQEDDLPAPESPYAVEKLASEQLMRIWPKLYGVSTVTLRYFNVFGPRQDPSNPYSGVVSIFAERLMHKKAVTIFGDGEQTRDFVAVADVVRANLLAGDLNEAPGLVVNVARGASTSINQLYQGLAKLLGGPELPKYEPVRCGDIRHSLANMERAQEQLGFEAQLSIAEGLKRLVDSL